MDHNHVSRLSCPPIHASLVTLLRLQALADGPSVLEVSHSINVSAYRDLDSNAAEAGTNRRETATSTAIAAAAAKLMGTRTGSSQSMPDAHGVYPHLPLSSTVQSSPQSTTEDGPAPMQQLPPTRSSQLLGPLMEEGELRALEADISIAGEYQ